MATGWGDKELDFTDNFASCFLAVVQTYELVPVHIRNAYHREPYW